MKKRWFILLSILGLVTILIWISVFSYSQETLRVIGCDVGQGDAFLITFRDSQILIDGGPNDKVLRCLSDYMPFWDRQIEVVILSHPQKDHFGGLIDVFEKYNVKYFLTTPLDSGSGEWSVLKDLVGGSATKVINPKEGNVYRFGLIYLDVLSPSEEYLSANLVGYQQRNSDNLFGAFSSKKDPNNFSVVVLLGFEDFNALFTGDIGPETIEQIMARGKLKDIDYLKVPHHGSKNGLTDELLRFASPDVAVISVGKNNSYGHPHKEVLDILAGYGVRILRTDQMGDVVVESNGKTFWIKD